jgi:hypothetical protein
MKQCPQCGAGYSDEFQFCSVDGNPLTSPSKSTFADFFALPFPTSIDFGFLMMPGNAVAGGIGALMAWEMLCVYYRKNLIGVTALSISSERSTHAFCAMAGFGILCVVFLAWNIYLSRKQKDYSIKGIVLTVLLCIITFGIIYRLLLSFEGALTFWGQFPRYIFLPAIIGLIAGISTSLRTKRKERTIYSMIPVIGILIILSYLFSNSTPFMRGGLIPWEAAYHVSSPIQIMVIALSGALIGIAASIKLKVKI